MHIHSTVIRGNTVQTQHLDHHGPSHPLSKHSWSQAALAPQHSAVALGKHVHKPQTAINDQLVYCLDLVILEGFPNL